VREADFADPDAPHAVVSAARAEFGHVDLLIVNHARSGRRRLAEVTASELDAFLHENVRASILLVKEFAVQHYGRSTARAARSASLVSRASSVRYACATTSRTSALSNMTASPGGMFACT
jgi:3-oxoacyl-[acyl-carrier protein] reductase